MKFFNNKAPSKEGLIQVSEVPMPVQEGMKQVFASYHLMTKDKSEQGFGNIVANFDPSQYADGRLDKFVHELQKSIEIVNEHRLGKPVIIQVLYFR